MLMKRLTFHLLTFLLMAAACVFVTSCGGGTSVKENAVLGRVPGLYLKSSQLRKDFKEWARNQNDAQKIHNKENDIMCSHANTQTKREQR